MIGRVRCGKIATASATAVVVLGGLSWVLRHPYGTGWTDPSYEGLMRIRMGPSGRVDVLDFLCARA